MRLKWRIHGESTRKYPVIPAGRGSWIGCASAWYADGRGFDPKVRQNILSLTYGHEENLRPFSPFRWFKKGSCQLLAKEWAVNTGKLPRKFAQEQSG